MRDDLLLTTSGVARILGISTQGVRWLITQGKLTVAQRADNGRASKDGRNAIQLFRRSDVMALAARRDATAHQRREGVA